MTASGVHDYNAQGESRTCKNNENKLTDHDQKMTEDQISDALVFGKESLVNSLW